MLLVLLLLGHFETCIPTLTQSLALTSHVIYPPLFINYLFQFLQEFLFTLVGRMEMKCMMR